MRQPPGRLAATPAGSPERTRGEARLLVGAPDPGNELGDDIAFFVRHGASPMGLSERPERDDVAPIRVRFNGEFSASRIQHSITGVAYFVPEIPVAAAKLA